MNNFLKFSAEVVQICNLYIFKLAPFIMVTIIFFDDQRLEVRDYITIVDIRCKKVQKLPQKIIFQVSQYRLFRRGVISQKRSRYVIFLFFYFHTLDITRKCAKFQKNPYWESVSN